MLDSGPLVLHDMMTYRNAAGKGPSQDHRKHVGSVVWLSSYANGQTDILTNVLITIFRSPPEGEVTSVSALGEKGGNVRWWRLCVEAGQ